MTAPIRIDVWSDVACPWCYLGKRRLDVALERLTQSIDAPAVAVEYHSYQLNPALPADFEGRHADYLAKHLGMAPARIEASTRDLVELRVAVGIRYNIDKVVISNTLKANELLHVAKAQGLQPSMKERLFHAFWTEGRRLGRIKELVDLAAEVGMDGEAVRGALESGRYAGAVRTDIEQAARYGVRGLPFFVIGGTYGLSGAQDLDTFLKAISTVKKELRGTA